MDLLSYLLGKNSAGDGVLDLVRYDGGRDYTALSPGKINGWNVVDAAGNVLRALS